MDKPHITEIRSFVESYQKGMDRETKIKFSVYAVRGGLITSVEDWADADKYFVIATNSEGIVVSESGRWGTIPWNSRGWSTPAAEYTLYIMAEGLGIDDRRIHRLITYKNLATLKEKSIAINFPAP